MNILCFGINHTTAPLDLREKLAFDEEHIRSSLYLVGSQLNHVSEMAILSTCNRVELYVASSELQFDDLEAFLANIQSIPVESFRTYAYRYTGEAVVKHLYRVATGLDSLVIGEPQILGQVTRALELALSVGTCGAVLSRLFRSAIHAGKRARSETGISRNPTSVSSLAASLVEKEVANLEDAQIVVIGAGEMAELAVDALRKRGATKIVIVNRTLERAHELANRLNAQVATLEQLDDLLQTADIVISSTSAPHIIINAPHLEEILSQRSRRSMVMVDIAVPRNIDPEINRIPGVKLFDMDTLEQQVVTLLAERAAEVPLVEAILAEEEQYFIGYLNTLDMLPIITELRKQADAIRQCELEKTLRRLPELTEAERDRIESMTRSLVKKLLETPTQRLRAEAACPQAAEYATVAQTLFDLPGERGVCSFSGQECLITMSGRENHDYPKEASPRR